jgi:hypothetical protein
MSPAAVSVGAAMLSMSQPRATDNRATRIVIPSRSTPASIPPAVDITMYSTTESSVCTPRMPHNMRARMARNTPRDEREDEGGLHVLGEDAAPEVEAEEVGLDRRREPAPHRPEDGTAHPYGGGYEHREPDELVEGARDAGEHDARDELPGRGEKKRGEPLPEGLLLLCKVAINLRSYARPVAQPPAYAARGPSGGSRRLFLSHACGIAGVADDVKLTVGVPGPVGPGCIIRVSTPCSPAPFSCSRCSSS